MSNVVQLFGHKPKPAEIARKPIDLVALSAMIVGWARDQGIDCEDAGFIIRVTDLIGQLQIMAMDSRERA